jgi:enolase
LKSEKPMSKIAGIRCQKILNSHAEFTNEFIIELEDGSKGVGASPRGETISIYEDKVHARDGEAVINKIYSDGCYHKTLSQEALDAYLQQNVNHFGYGNCFAISLAFYNALENIRSHARKNEKTEKRRSFPRLCLNILNGGQHAYTNPVLSDFPEYLLVPKHNDFFEMIDEHGKIQRGIRERLTGCEKVVVNNNSVNRLQDPNNASWIEMLLDLLKELKLDARYDVMIDASAGDLWQEGKYKFSLTDHSERTGAEMCAYWMELIEKYDIRFLEDPFYEKDIESWKILTSKQKRCCIIGDNLYASRSDKIQKGAEEKYTNGVIIKPDQAGTVTGTIEAIRTSQANKQIVITSHRSISTESTFLSFITCAYDVEYIKIGPLFTDYSSILRFNKIIRLVGEG